MDYLSSVLTRGLPMRAFVILLVLLQTAMLVQGESLDDKLQGRWQQVAYRDEDPNAQYHRYSPDRRYFKFYSAGFFNVVYARGNGHVDVFYGGRYNVVGEHELVEIVEYYAPYKDLRFAMGREGQAILYDGKSMVGAQFSLRVEFVDGEMSQRGILTQNTAAKKEEASAFGDRAVDYLYRRATDETPERHAASGNGSL